MTLTPIPRKTYARIWDSVENSIDISINALVKYTVRNKTRMSIYRTIGNLIYDSISNSVYRSINSKIYEPKTNQ